MTKTGTIRIVATPSGKGIVLRGDVTNPDPPPATVVGEVWVCAAPPGWLLEACIGNAGVTCTVTLDEAGAPVSAVVG